MQTEMFIDLSCCNLTPSQQLPDLKDSTRVIASTYNLMVIKISHKLMDHFDNNPLSLQEILLLAFYSDTVAIECLITDFFRGIIGIDFHRRLTDGQIRTVYITFDCSADWRIILRCTTFNRKSYFLKLANVR